MGVSQVAYALMLHVVIGYMLIMRHESFNYAHAAAEGASSNVAHALVQLPVQATN